MGVQCSAGVYIVIYVSACETFAFVRMILEEQKTKISPKNTDLIFIFFFWPFGQSKNQVHKNG